ncbi:MAG: hypothetical protein ACRD0P_29760, partial [Stackebrandtia sp.]
TKTVVMKAAAGDVIRFDAATDHLADVLAQLGDTDTKDQRRAKAVGWLADPQARPRSVDRGHVHQPRRRLRRWRSAHALRTPDRSHPGHGHRRRTRRGSR